MKLLFACTRAPRDAGFGGAAFTTGWLLREFLSLGYEVQCLYFALPENNGEPYSAYEADRSYLQSMGVTDVACVDLPDPLPLAISWKNLSEKVVNILSNRWRHGKNEALVRQRVKKAAEQLNPDACFLYDEVANYFTTFQSSPKIAWLPHTWEPFVKIAAMRGDNHMFFGSHSLAKKMYPLHLRALQNKTARWIRTIDYGVCPSYYYAKRWKELFPDIAARVLYIPHPAKDESADIPPRDFLHPPPNNPFKVAMLGGTFGTTTYTQLGFLLDEVMPALDRRGLSDRFEFNLIGRHNPHSSIATRLNRPNIKPLGFLPSIGDTLNAADAVLQCIPEPPGAGMRLSTLTSAYPCLVVHSVVPDGFPEFKSRLNCLAAGSGEGIVNALMEVCTNRDLNASLRNEARKVYENLYRPSRCVDTVDTIIRNCFMGRSLSAK